jgi:glycosyltransferase involved in cell wall biosynthesis
MQTAWSLSIVIPAFNRERHISTAIRSAIEQTVPPDEIIVVDDGSTDRTAQVAKTCGSSVRVITIDNNGTGPARPRNVGIEAARSSHIMFLDSDDFLEPRAVERFRDVSTAAPHAALVASNFFIKCDADGHASEHTVNDALAARWIRGRVPASPGVYVVPSSEAYRAYCEGNFLRVAAMVPRAVCLDVGGFSETLTPSEDVAFFFRVLERYDLAYIDEPLHTYVRHMGNISTSCLGRQFRAHVGIQYICVLEQELKRCHDAKCRSALERRIVEQLEFLAYGYRTNGRPLHAIRAYLKYYRCGGSRSMAARGVVAAALEPLRSVLRTGNRKRLFRRRLTVD